MAPQVDGKLDKDPNPDCKASQVASIRSPFSKNVTIFLVACFLIASRAVHSILCQPFNIHEISLEVFITFAEAASFPVSVLIWVAASYWSQGRVYVPNWRYRIPMYALMGFLDAVNSFMSAFSALGLNVAVYTVLKASSIVFSVMFSLLFTKKQFTSWHYLAVVVMFGASFLSFFDASKAAMGLTTPVITRCVAALVSAASLGLLGVVTYKFVRHEQQKSELLCIAENNAFQALFMFIFVLPMLAMPEVSQWPRRFDQFMEIYSMPTLIGITVGFFVARPVILFSSIAATSFASAALTRALGAPRRLLVVAFTYLVFDSKDQKKFSFLKGVFISLMCVALMIYTYGGSVLRKMKQRAEKQAVLDTDAEKGMAGSSKHNFTCVSKHEIVVPTKQP